MTDWIDLTRPLNADLPIYAEPGYSDPPFAAERWCGIGSTGFEVWKLTLGTQTGTHIDAPSHFVSDAPSLDSLAVTDCMGPCFHVSNAALGSETPDRDYAGEPLLFLDGHPETTLAEGALQDLLALPPRVWIMAGAITVAGGEPFRFNRALADTGKFLVEDLDPTNLARIGRVGEAIVLPLRLTGVSGSPVRLLVRADC